MSMTREQIRQLAEFKDNNSCAVTFYFQPSTPRNKAHKEDTILIKDLARESVRNLEKKMKKDGKKKENLLNRKRKKEEKPSRLVLNHYKKNSKPSLTKNKPILKKPKEEPKKLLPIK